MQGKGVVGVIMLIMIISSFVLFNIDPKELRHEADMSILSEHLSPTWHF